MGYALRSAVVLLSVGGWASIASAEPPVKNWSGFYVGTQTGAAFDDVKVGNPFGNSIYGSDVPTGGYVAGIIVGYNQQYGRQVVGVEADANLASLFGDNTCLAVAGNYVSANCVHKVNSFGTVALRYGYLLGDDMRTMLYGKAGGAWMTSNTRIDNGNQYYGFQPDLSNSTNHAKMGWMLGLGVERALNSAWSLKFEYDYLDFGNTNAAFPRSVQFPPLAIIPGGTTSINDNIHVFMLGLNYKLGHEPVVAYSSARDPYLTPLSRSGWGFTAGARYWYSTGKFQWDNKVPDGVLQSRLTYDDVKAHTGELFARLDMPHSIFVKGYVGLGSIGSGKQNDEDWGIGGNISYSNTVSDIKTGYLGYATVDVGYDLLKGTGYKVGPFIGYTFFTQRQDINGCVQIASATFPCLAPGNDRLVGTQDTTWNAMRLGTAAEVALGHGMRLNVDAAYLTQVGFSGRDNHLLRTTTTYFDQTGSNGQGVQLDAILSFDLSRNFTLGVGGRYWSMWADGTFTCTGCGGAGVTSNPPNPSRTSADRAGLLLQGTYRFE